MNKKYKRIAVYLLSSIAGMVITHFIPTCLLPIWIGVSLGLGHAVNEHNYKKNL